MDRFARPPSIVPPAAKSVANDDLADDSQRSRSRDSLFLMGRLTLPGSTKQYDVRIRNLSEGGLMAELDRPVAIGSAVLLDMRGIGDVTGVVAWCAEGRIGVALDQPIDPRAARKQVGGGGTTPIFAKPARP